ncbi:MAG: MarR family transcriptional regulator [Novosphingobium sp.]
MDPASADESLLHLPGFALRRAANVMMGKLTAQLSEMNLRLSDASVMLLVSDRNDMTSADIGKELDIQRANMVPVLARLEEAGLIQREPIDRKSQAIMLTPAGVRKLAQVRDVTDRFENELLNRIPAKHRPHFLPALLSLIQ